MKSYPITDLKTQKKIEHYLSVTNQRNYILWLVGVNTGLRISDILNLKVGDIKEDYIYVQEIKTKKIRQIKINNKLKIHLNDFISDKKSSDYLFTFKNKNTKLSRSTIHVIMKGIQKNLNIDVNMSTHTMRKTYAYNIFTLSNKDITKVSQALRHKNVSSTLTYVTLDDRIIDNYNDKLAYI